MSRAIPISLLRSNFLQRIKCGVGYHTTNCQWEKGCYRWRGGSKNKLLLAPPKPFFQLWSEISAKWQTHTIADIITSACQLNPAGWRHGGMANLQSPPGESRMSSTPILRTPFGIRQLSAEPERCSHMTTPLLSRGLLLYKKLKDP